MLGFCLSVFCFGLFVINKVAMNISAKNKTDEGFGADRNTVFSFTVDLCPSVALGMKNLMN